MKTLLILLCSILATFGVKAEGIIGTRTNENGDGVVQYSTAGEINPDYNYIHYEEGEIGQEYATLLIYETWEHEDDIAVRSDIDI